MSNRLTDFRSLYSSARFFVKQGNAKDARLYILALLDILKQIRTEAPNAVSRLKTEEEIMRFLTCARILRENGVTDEVRRMFGLIKDEPPMSEETPSPTRSGQPIDYAAEEHSQGWCADIFDRYKRAVVKVCAESGLSFSGGTGFFVSKEGYLLTNHHVVYDEDADRLSEKVTVSFEGERIAYPVKVIATNRERDVALLHVEDKLSSFGVVSRIKDYASLKQGADVLVIGNAFSMGLAPFSGTVKFTHEPGAGDLVYTAPSNPGDSGGPVLNRSGDCVGINKSVTAAITRGGRRIESQGLTNATPMDEIEDMLREWSKQYELTL